MPYYAPPKPKKQIQLATLVHITDSNDKNPLKVINVKKNNEKDSCCSCLIL